jgi:hypothetical protein
MAKKRKAFKRPPAKSSRAPPPDDAAASGAVPPEAAAGIGLPMAAGETAAPAGGGPMTDEMRMRSRYGGG